MQTSQKNLYKKLLGRRGELKAKKYLKKAGYKILESNFATRFGEIDLIAKKDGVICFVEVKTRKNIDFGYPAEAVGKVKQEKYVIVANEYLQRKGLTDKICRFDVIEVLGGEINHIENAFFA